jgi:acyl carrier protein
MKASMHRSEIETEFAALLDRVAGTPPSSVGRDTHLDALGLGSLAKIDLAVAAEDRFGVAISDEDLECFVTVGDVMDYVERASS